jgi:hypothetical protein
MLYDVPMEMKLLSVLLDVMEKLCLLDPNILPIFVPDYTHGRQCSVALRKCAGTLSRAQVTTM